MSDSQTREHLALERVLFFSDAVFAIAITLLVLDIGVPDGSGGDLLGAIADQWPAYLAYLVSFSTIASRARIRTSGGMHITTSINRLSTISNQPRR